MASHQHAHGNSENVLGFTKDNKVFINDEPLKKMFLHADVKNRKIVAFSIIGAYRKGKSFFLDYCLRYLYAHYPSINNPKNSLSNPTDWLGDENEPLSGFSWRSGTDRDTTGIVIWNDVFLHKDEATGNEIAIIVVDTHGLFDNVTSSMDNSRIFTLDILISSIQVFNLSGVIQDDHLQFLQSAIECAKFASKMDIKKDAKCLQNLVFLIRDWTNTEEFYYGIDDGQSYWEHFREKSGKQKVELAYICESILDSYDDVSCTLLPHPGKSVATGTRGYNGSWSKIDEDFTEELGKLVDHLLKPENLVIKKVNGSALNGDEFYEYLNGQLKVFEKDELLQSQIDRVSMTRKEMEILLSTCIEHYKQVGMEHRKNIQNECEIPLIHEKSKEAAMTMYNEAQKMGSAGEHENYRKVLDRKIEEIYKNLIQQQIQKEKETAEEQLEKIRQASKHALELENQKKEQELAELIEKSIKECAEIEKRKEVARQAADDEIRAIRDKVEKTRIEVERRQREQNSSEQSNQDQHSNADNILKGNEEVATDNIGSLADNPTRSQCEDMQLESEINKSKEYDSQMQTIVAEDNVIKIDKRQKSFVLYMGICDSDEQSEYKPANVINGNSSGLNETSSTIDNKQTASKAPQSNYNHGLVKVPSGGSYHGEPSTSKSTDQPQRMINDKEVKKNKISKENRNQEVYLASVDRIPVESASTDYKVDSGSSYEVAELATILSSNRKHRQDLDNTAIIMNPKRLCD
ncbi:atlastin-like isoform X2 [Chironomus tepperi]|uniref:atlastin-like isoform X2 n=1 Tax=Chironomus tepperi TaxID=113505 RepID=UPI00391FC567